MVFNPKFLLQLIEIAEKGSFSKAAGSLNVTQPALSRNMREFEQILGLSLLDRGRQGASPTEFGERILRYGKVIQEMLHRIEIEAQCWQEGTVGPLQIGATPHPSKYVSQVLSKFLDGRPKLIANLFIADFPILLQRLEFGELDIVVGPTGLIQLPHGIVASNLYTDELVIVAGQSHALATRRKISNTDLESSLWLGHPVDSTIHRQATAILASKGLTEVSVQTRQSIISDFVCMLMTGRYLAILPRRSVDEDIESGNIIVLPVALEGSHWPIGVLHRKLPMLPKTVQMFKDQLTVELAKGP
jgi:LysR family pca operon transcriptional activator